MESSNINLWPCIENLRKKNPLVHNITNYVVMHTVANSLLAAGASPIMAHALEEIEEITSLASALSLNIGTLSPAWVASMEKSIEVASQKHIPIVLDPVGAGASRLRTDVSLHLLSLIPTPVIRGNASEIMALAGYKSTTKGVDSTAQANAATGAAKELAGKYSATVCISGAEDIILDKTYLVRLSGGSAIMPRVTGMGCTASALVAACLPLVNKADTILAVASAMGLMSTAGAIAETKCQGPGTFLVHFIDALANSTEQDMTKHIKIF